MKQSKHKPIKSELLLPRGYLSWSALDLFEKSEDKYIRKYFYGEDVDFKNEFMTFGKKFAEAKETGNCNGDTILEIIVNSTPSYGNPEYEIVIPLDTPYGTVNILCKLDDFNDKNIEIIEFKTGSTKWTQSRVDSHGQLHFYSVGIYAKHHIIPEGQLWWIPTKKHESGEVVPTGELHKFYFKSSPFEIKEMVRRITRAALRIDKLYREHIKLCSTDNNGAPMPKN